LAFAGPVWRKLADCHAQGKHILFEGAQGAMLDVDFGTYPFVTSSNTGAGQAASGTGFAPAKIDYVLGVAKAYSTRVGHGPFPSELKDEIGDYLVECGKEFGTVTGRKRRCGWFDAPLVHQMVQIHGLGGIALTRLDVLDGLERLAICTGYEIDGIFVQDLPALSSLAFRARPVLEYHPGWQKPTSSIRDYDALPEQARGYIERIESLIKAPVALCSVGPERDATIMRQHPFGR
ncbi:MAG: adenylosuccinate synthetase, partial [Pseudomonadota bacterium]